MTLFHTFLEEVYFSQQQQENTLSSSSSSSPLIRFRFRTRHRLEIRAAEDEIPCCLYNGISIYRLLVEKKNFLHDILPPQKKKNNCNWNQWQARTRHTFCSNHNHDCCSTTTTTTIQTIQENENLDRNPNPLPPPPPNKPPPPPPPPQDTSLVNVLEELTTFCNVMICRQRNIHITLFPD